MRFALTLAILGLCQLSALAQIPILRPSDVVLMYQAPREIYDDYGPTWLAWGEKPTPASLPGSPTISTKSSPLGSVARGSRASESSSATASSKQSGRGVQCA